MAARTTEIQLRGAGGEPVDLRRTITSHGVADLPPNRIDEAASSLEVTMLLDGAGASTLRVSAGRNGHARVEVLAGRATVTQVRTAAAHVLRLDEDLSPFYTAAAADPTVPSPKAAMDKAPNPIRPRTTRINLMGTSPGCRSAPT